MWLTYHLVLLEHYEPRWFNVRNSRPIKIACIVKTTVLREIFYALSNYCKMFEARLCRKGELEARFRLRDQFCDRFLRTWFPGDWLETLPPLFKPIRRKKSKNSPRDGSVLITINCIFRAELITNKHLLTAVSQST